MHTRQLGAVLYGIDACPIQVEVDLSGGLPGIYIAGLPDPAIRESCLRVRAALRNAGFPIPRGRITVNLAPAGLRKEGTGLDLPIAAAIVAADDPDARQAQAGSILIAGELALSGEVRPVRGALSMALLAKRCGWSGFLLPHASAPEAAAVDGLPLYPIGTLGEAIELLRAAVLPAPASIPPPVSACDEEVEDFCDVRGQAHARRAVEIACAGGHNLLFVGPPGSGKTMLARRIPSVLPPLSEREAIEVTRIHSVTAGWEPRRGLMRRRPFRAPHHTISPAGLVGGGHSPRPGEASLAHGGVLFLDELPEFRRGALEVLRQPLEEGRIRIMRSMRSVEFPSRFLLVAAMNPCRCGYHGDGGQRCRCTPLEVDRYRGVVSGPLLDRIDMHVEVPRLPFRDLVDRGAGESSAAIRARVLAARSIQAARFAGARRGGGAAAVNAAMQDSQLRRYCPLEGPGRALLERAVDRLGLSARAVGRIRKVARTIADLDGRDAVRPGDLAEAIQYRR